MLFILKTKAWRNAVPILLKGMKRVKEIWKDIKGYEGLYQVSSHGRVKRLGNNKTKKEMFLSPAPNDKGYLYAHLSKNNKKKTIAIHRLVAMEFINNSLNLPEVNHKDENKGNNHYYNLEWCDRAYNNTYGNRIIKMVNTRITQ